MDQLDVRIAPHFAKDGGAFHRLVSDAVEFPEEDGAFDFGHSEGSD
jgi:hypothetical protein